jgi:hypothetical protein
MEIEAEDDATLPSPPCDKPIKDALSLRPSVRPSVRLYKYINSRKTEKSSTNLKLQNSGIKCQLI